MYVSTRDLSPNRLNKVSVENLFRFPSFQLIIELYVTTGGSPMSEETEVSPRGVFGMNKNQDSLSYDGGRLTSSLPSKGTRFPIPLVTGS